MINSQLLFVMEYFYRAVFLLLLKQGNLNTHSSITVVIPLTSHDTIAIFMWTKAVPKSSQVFVSTKV